MGTMSTAGMASSAGMAVPARFASQDDKARLVVIPGSAGLTSKAEAKLNARIRPDVTLMRSRSTAARAAARQAAAPEAGAADPVAAAVRTRPERSPIRLTRRGRIVVATLIAVGLVAVAGVLWLAVAGQARASNQVRSGSGSTHALQRVIVRPGQTLWGIASAADPAADPRAVIQEIIDENELAGTSIEAGQVLWVPRS